MNMELDDLKSLWKESANEKNNEPSLEAILERRSQGPIARMRRNLMMELLFVIIAYGGMIAYFFFAYSGRLRGISWFLVFLSALFIFYYLMKDRLLKEMSCPGCHLRSNLEKQLMTLRKYIKYYLVVSTALLPISLLFYFVLIETLLPDWSKTSAWFFNSQHPWWKPVLLWIPTLTLFTVIVYFINAWYIRKLYGNHVEKLTRILDELKQDEIV
jgi:hypothetical protein